MKIERIKSMPRMPSELPPKTLDELKRKKPDAPRQKMLIDTVVISEEAREILDKDKK